MQGQGDCPYPTHFSRSSEVGVLAGGNSNLKGLKMQAGEERSGRKLVSRCRGSSPARPLSVLVNLELEKK
eukprot:scaffold143989_cov133-Phaeocystis_antarctica.AAC.1